MKKILVAIAIIFLLLLSGITAFVTLTTPGLNLLITLTKRITPGVLSVASSNGSLINGVVLHGIRYDDGEYEVLITKAAIAIKLPALMRKELVVTSLTLTNVALKELQSTPSSNTGKLPQVTLPIALYLEQAVVESVDINQPATNKRLHLQKLSLKHLSMVGNHLQVASFNLLHEQFAVELKGELRTTGDYPVHISSAYHITPDHYQPIYGKSTFEGHLLDCVATSNLVKPVQATLSSRFVMNKARSRWNIEATSNTVGLSAINSLWPNIVLDDVLLSGNGTFDKATLTIQATSNLADYPNLEGIATQATIKLNKDRLRITEFGMTKGTSHIHATGHLDWKKAVAWSIEAQVKEFDPSIWFAGWQGMLNGRGSMQGHLTAKGVYADISLTDLQGQLRGYPLYASGKAALHESILDIESFHVSSGDSQLTAHGKWGKSVNLNLSLQSPDAAQLWPDITGSITSAATIQGTRENPDIALHLSGTAIAYKANSIDRLEASAQGNWSTDGKLGLQLSASDVTVFDQHAEEVQVTITGNPENVAFQARLKEDQHVSTISLHGEQYGQKWHGKVDQVTIDTKKTGSWELQQPSSFAVTTKEITINETCLTSALAEEICTDGTYASNSPWTITSNIKKLSTQTLQNIFTQKNHVQGYIRGSLHLSGQHKNIDQGQLTIGMVDAKMVSAMADEIGSLQRIQGKLSATYVNDELKAATRISLDDGSYIESNVAINVAEESQTTPEAFDLALLPITGKMTLQIKDIDAINVFWEEHAKITGMLQGSLKIEGNLKHPIITGDIQLTHGTANLFSLGVTLDPLLFQAQINDNQLSLSANAQSGTGKLSATGTVYLDKGLLQDLYFSINGTQFKVADNDEMKVFISPDLVVKRSNGLVYITGSITFPEAHISYQGREGTVTPSSDVVIVDADENTAQSAPSLPLNTSITLIAGDAVDIDAYGLKGILKGNLHVTNTSGEIPLATGTLLINNGTFILYGKRLDIDVGRLLFSGGPLDNPGIEVRTEKRDNGTTVGMEVGGFLQHPEIRFYSSTAMEQYEILTRLLANSSSPGEVQDQTGVIGQLATKVGLPQLGEALQSSKNMLSIDDIRLETGDFFDDLSLIIGTWLTPRFYVSYGHSLLKDSASFNTRYTLGKGFFFQTETSTTQNGGDIIYEIEN